MQPDPAWRGPNPVLPDTFPASTPNLSPLNLLFYTPLALITSSAISSSESTQMKPPFHSKDAMISIYPYFLSRSRASNGIAGNCQQGYSNDFFSSFKFFWTSVTYLSIQFILPQFSIIFIMWGLLLLIIIWGLSFYSYLSCVYVV